MTRRHSRTFASLCFHSVLDTLLWSSEFFSPTGVAGAHGASQPPRQLRKHPRASLTWAKPRNATVARKAVASIFFMSILLCQSNFPPPAPSEQMKMEHMGNLRKFYRARLGIPDKLNKF